MCHNKISRDTKRARMISLSIREIRSELARVEEILASEGEVIITRRGSAVARLLPIKSVARSPSHADLRARMKRMPEGSEVLIRQERDSD